MALVLSALGACEGPAPVPANPTWAEDVLPILRGNCFGCHGAGPTCGTEKKEGCRPLAALRWDVYDPADFPNAAEAGITSGVRGAIQNLIARAKSDDARMPPPPASPLDDRQIQTLENFAKTIEAAAGPAAIAKAKGRHTPNHVPFARLVSRSVQSGTLTVLFEVVDRNDDQVLGSATAGGDPILIDRSGGHTLKFPGAAKDAAITVTLSDGWANTSTTLK